MVVRFFFLVVQRKVVESVFLHKGLCCCINGLIPTSVPSSVANVLELTIMVHS